MRRSPRSLRQHPCQAADLAALLSELSGPLDRRIYVDARPVIGVRLDAQGDIQLKLGASR